MFDKKKSAKEVLVTVELCMQQYYELLEAIQQKNLSGMIPKNDFRLDITKARDRSLFQETMNGLKKVREIVAKLEDI